MRIRYDLETLPFAIGTTLITLLFFGFYFFIFDYISNINCETDTKENDLIQTCKNLQFIQIAFTNVMVYLFSAIAIFNWVVTLLLPYFRVDRH